MLVKKVELSDEEKNDLSDKLLQVKKGMKVVVRYFVKAAESTGKYISLTGTVVMIDASAGFPQRKFPAPYVH